MIILDTNVVSELMRQQPDPNVINWIQSYNADRFTLTAITVAEIMRGLTRLPEGKRRRELANSFDQFINKAFSQKILPFDTRAAMIFGDLAANREKSGKSIDTVDMMIAAIAKTHSAAIATRNTRDFEACQITLMNPWDA